MRTLLTLTLLLVAAGCSSPQATPAADAPQPRPAGSAKLVVTTAAEVDWQQLNPARGDASPKAATLWGDRNGEGPTGFLVQFVDGFSSPPHIHNVSYRGVVINGLVHNDDANAEPMWMPPGSFWTQPKGGAHITSAKGDKVTAYIEIEAGPYLVKPTEEAFDSGEVPVNVDRTNIVWLDAADVAWMAQSGAPQGENGPQVAFLWGKPHTEKLYGSFLKLPGGFSGTVESPGPSFSAVVIAGQATHQTPGQDKPATLDPGSHFSAQGASKHQLSCVGNQACTLYIRAQGKFNVTAAP